jgi:M6 family metalloprotease-like protein
MKKYLLSLFLVFISSMVLKASYVTSEPCQVKQPDGEVIDCFVSGDEFFNWLHDAEGFTIIQAPDGYFYYGMVEGDLVVPTQYQVNTVNPEQIGLRKWAKVSLQEYERRKNLFTRDNNTSVTAPHTGAMNNLVVYIKFSDDTEFTTTRQTFDNRFNPASGSSLKSYFSEVSYNQLTISSTHYPECAMNTNFSYKDTHPRGYFQPYIASTNPNGYQNDDQRTIREHQLLRDAIEWINLNSPVAGALNIDSDNDGLVDNISFIIRGSSTAWSSLLWAHRWVLYSYNVFINGKQVWDYTFQPETQVSVTMTCHEMFHTLGAPDLYHYTGNGIDPVSTWDLMQNGSGHMGSYMKWKYSGNNWISNIPEITATGTYTLNPLASATNNCYRVASPNSASQYYVVEYRQKTGTFESNLPGSGLLVYRIDPLQYGNASGPPDEVYIYRPDGTITINGNTDLAFFSAESGRTTITDATNPSGFLQNGSAGGLNISNVTSAGSTISFTVNLDFVTTPISLSATPLSATEIQVEWQKNGAGNNVMLAWSATPTFGTPVEGTAYGAGSLIPGGGTVLYSGDGLSFLHTPLTAGTTWYYKLWSVDALNSHSIGITDNATTYCATTSLPINEAFTASFPACWSQQVTGINAVNSWIWYSASYTWAGGSPGEIYSLWQDINPATTRLVTPPFSTAGMSELSLSFRHYLYDWAPGATVRVQSSSDGISWTNETWSKPTASNSGNGAEIINTNITNNLNSPTTFLAFTAEGNLNQYTYWFIDDVSVQVSKLITTTIAGSQSTEYEAESVVLTAAVSPIPSGGNITFYVEGILAGSATLNTTTGVAQYTFNPSSLAIGTYTVRADYSGSGIYLPGSSNPLHNGTLTITPQTLTWTGATNTDWSTPDNWSPNVLPSAVNNIHIPDVANDPLINNQLLINPAVCNDLNIETGAILTIASGNALTVNGELTSTAGVGGLILNSGASLIENSAAAATVQRAIGANEWHFISPPVSNAESTQLTGRYLQKFNESTYSWSDIISLTENLTPLRGYALWGDNGFTASLSGTLNTGMVSIPVTRNNSLEVPKYPGWNLVGNPYPSSVDWNTVAGWTKTNVTATLYIHVNATTWATYNKTTGITNNGSNYIPPFQGFFVEASAAGSLGINNAARTHLSNTFFKSPGEVIPNLLRMQVSGNGFMDEATVVFLPEATPRFDGEYDAHKLYGDVPEAAQIYTMGDKELAVNALPEVALVPLGIRAGTNSTLTLTATEINNLGTVTLEDTRTGIFTDIVTSAYTFNHVAGTNEIRFRLHFGPLGMPETGSPTAQIYSYYKTVYINLAEKQSSDIYIYTLSGQLLTSKLSATGINEIRIERTGIYLVKVLTGKGILVRKVYIQ